MPNYCDYEMRIKGSKNAIERVIECLNTGYNYGEGKPSHKHFFRVFQCEEGELADNKDGTFTIEVYGYCAWSVYCAMMGTTTDKMSYYASVQADYPDIFMGTNLWEQSEDCEIEVFGEETEGMWFSEHYYFKNGECLVNESIEITPRRNSFRERGTDMFHYDHI